MIRLLHRLAPLLAPILALLASAAARADGVPGAFDHYVLALSWNPSWCEEEGDARGAPQCDRRAGWLLHGLWPQYAEAGWPEDCPAAAADPSRRMTAAMEDIMGSAGLAWHEWKRHGRCTGLSADAYFDLSRAAWEAVERPALLRRLERPVRIDPDVVEDAFLAANPALAPEGVVVTCRDGRIAEVRICLARDLSPRPCTAEVAARACRSPARLPAVR